MREKTILLIIDEGQKIPPFCLEILREFLNYETNTHKLLQIIIFAQEEFKSTLENYDNFSDRINLYLRLGPMTFRDMRRMIQFRLQHAAGDASAPYLFSGPALYYIYRATKGYPRKVITLCHQITLALIIKKKKYAGSVLG